MRENISPSHRSAFRHSPPGASGRPAATRREFLFEAGGGLGGLALAAMLSRDGELAAAERHPSAVLPPKANRVGQVFMAGASSQLDLFDF